MRNSASRWLLLYDYITIHDPNVKIPNIYVPRQSFRRQKSDMKKAPYWVPKNVKRHRKRFLCFGDLANGSVQP